MRGVFIIGDSYVTTFISRIFGFNELVDLRGLGMTPKMYIFFTFKTYITTSISEFF